MALFQLPQNAVFPDIAHLVVVRFHYVFQPRTVQAEDGDPSQEVIECTWPTIIQVRQTSTSTYFSFQRSITLAPTHTPNETKHTGNSPCLRTG